MLALRRTSPALLSLILTVPAAPATPRWDHPGYDAEDSYYNPHESAVVASSIGSLAKKWSVTLRHADETCTGSGPPVVRNGQVFVSDGLGVSAYSVKTGARDWTFNVVDPVDTVTPTLAVDAGVLLVGTSSCRPSGSEQELTALEADSGRIRWKRSQGQPMASMVTDKGVVVVSGYSDIFDDAQTTAYRTSDGRMLWNKTGQVATDVSADGVVLIRKVGDDGDTPGTTTAVAIDTGVARWTRTGNWYAQAADPAADRFYVINGNGKLAALNVADGKVLWTKSIDADAEVTAGSHSVRLAVDGKRVYHAYQGAIDSLDAKTGKRRWRTKTTGDAQQPILAGGLIYTGGTVLNAAQGKPVGPSFTGDVVVAGGQLYQVNGKELIVYSPS